MSAWIYLGLLERLVQAALVAQKHREVMLAILKHEEHAAQAHNVRQPVNQAMKAPILRTLSACGPQPRPATARSWDGAAA